MWPCPGNRHHPALHSDTSGLPLPAAQVNRPLSCASPFAQISTRHKFQLFHVLEAIVRASDSLEETWEKTFMQLALGNMTKSTMAIKSVQFLNTGVWSEALLRALTKPDRTYQEQPPEKEEPLRQSYPTAVPMLVEAISRNEGSHSYEFSLISELLECLMASASKLRPPTSSERKSQLLSICLHSVLALPLLDVLEKHTCLFLEPPNIQHLSGWLVAEKAQGRQQAVHSCMALLKFLSHDFYLDATNALYELQFTQEFKKAVQEAYAELLLALLTRIHDILELSLPKEPQPSQEAREAATSSPQSPTLLEVLPREAALTMLEQSLGDPSPDVCMLSLQGLGNIIFHPEKMTHSQEFSTHLAQALSYLHSHHHHIKTWDPRACPA
ncbi:Maestro Heat-Like Repeat Family Member 5 [Manis pentadactyla]|nr:Maestro Heat-Like Repeat Family Member 5 [Manis pentadactyla]